MKTIMVIDDEPEILKLVKSSLEKDAFAVVTAKNSRQALELLDNEKEVNFGLILIDTTMPGSKKRALFSMIPGTKKDTSNINDFLQKPFTDKQLVDFVKRKM